MLSAPSQEEQTPRTLQKQGFSSKEVFAGVEGPGIANIWVRAKSTPIRNRDK